MTTVIQWDTYPDKGCEVASSCFACPLAQCRYDDLAAYRRWRRGKVDEQAASMRDQGVTTEEIAVFQGVRLRTVFRRQRRHQFYLTKEAT